MARGPVGQATRGTTGTNRLRRVDRWIASRAEFLGAVEPLVIDLGYGASGVTAFELHDRLYRTRQDVEVLGLEIDQDRVERARQQLVAVRAGETTFRADARVSFARGGFEVPSPRQPHIIRAFNVLRQYDESQVHDAWSRMAARLAVGGLLVEGTCDEIGRIASWVDVDHTATPLRLTVSLRLAELERPGVVAERLPKALIHRNVAGERVHAFLEALDRAWERQSPLSAFGAVQRWTATVRAMREDGWPVMGERRRWRLGEITVPWSAVAPSDGDLAL